MCPVVLRVDCWVHVGSPWLSVAGRLLCTASHSQILVKFPGYCGRLEEFNPSNLFFFSENFLTWHATRCIQIENYFLLGVFPPDSGLQPFPGCYFIPPEPVTVTHGKAAHNFNKTGNFILLRLSGSPPPIGIGRVMMKTPVRAHRPQASLPRKVWGWRW